MHIKKLYFGIILLNILDILTTLYGLSIGCTEQNPIAKNIFLNFSPLIAMIIMKIIGLIIIFTIINIKIYKPFKIYVLYIIFSIFIIVFLNNLYFITR